MFTRPDVRTALQNFVLLDLFTDGTDAESAKNQDMENKLFSTVASVTRFLPFLQPKGMPVWSKYRNGFHSKRLRVRPRGFIRVRVFWTFRRSHCLCSVQEMSGTLSPF